MDRLLIIADDFTGALDTGIQFAKLGIKTKILTDYEYDFHHMPCEVQVIVVDAETRPLNAEDAYNRVYRLTSNAAESGIRYFYKKTDSALRGNIGKELEAVADGCGRNIVCFIPALPRNKRLTRDGIHYIDGVPVEQSIFGKDPFEPVQYSSVEQIIHSQSDINVKNIRVSDYGQVDWDAETKTVFVFDVESEENLQEIAQLLKENDRYCICGGCAGFAAYYPRLLSFEQEKTLDIIKTDGLLCLCGSVNPITGRQLDYAGNNGFVRENMKCSLKMNPDSLRTESGKLFFDELFERISREKCYIIDTLDQPGSEKVMEYAEKHGLSDYQVRTYIAETLGLIVQNMIERGLDYTISMTGGDTLMGFMKLTGCTELIPVCEIGQGAVLSRLVWKDTQIQVISKSGGFGDENIFVEIADRVVRREEI